MGTGVARSRLAHARALLALILALPLPGEPGDTPRMPARSFRDALGSVRRRIDWTRDIVARKETCNAMLKAGIASLFLLFAGASEKATLELRLVPIADGLPADTAKLQQVASSVGVDVTEPDHPLVIAACRDGTVFFLFCKTVDNAFGDRPYLIQRIKKTVKEYDEEGDSEPRTTVTYQVEVFKTICGTVKGGGDEHYGRYGLSGCHRREITKEYEIGFGEVPGQCTGRDWPFSATSLYKLLEPYGPDPTTYERVRFSNSRKWSLSVTLAEDGSFSVRSPEFGFDLPETPPKESMAEPWIDPASRSLVLNEGAGVLGLEIGRSREPDIRRKLGDPLDTTRAGEAASNVSYTGGLTCNVYDEGALNTIMTRPSFGGRTSRGIRHGATRAEVLEAYGSKPNNDPDAPFWSFDCGVSFWFTRSGRVEKIVLTAPD